MASPADTKTHLNAELRRLFGFNGFRPSQEEVCLSLTSGEDTLLVMPTGAGKSLCYQLPGMILKGQSSSGTLVISPLLALIDDQTAKLRSFGFRAEAIHSGIARDRARGVCREYLRGELDFLFIAPERLAVPGFPEMLARRKPALLAIDEAHCISQWGHDFRPEYRKLGERVASLRPAPIIALTATATPIVQDDILKQLDIPLARRYIQGFRRENIAIEAHEVPRGARGRAVLEILSEPGRLPAIVYAPTRKMAEELAGELQGRFRAETYHAGMAAERREAVQTRFLGSACDVIVATIAFGMGIDKPDVRTVIHAGLSGSVEGYYQEIGRAGRDGLPSKAILLHSYADTRTHEFFFERDYPEVAELRRIHRALGEGPVPRGRLQADLGGGLGADGFEKALEKLWIHGGISIDPEERISRGPPSWEQSYARQRQYKRQMLRQMTGFAETRSCRMSYLIRHFGDRADAAGPCGICDRCGPGKPRHGFSATRKLSPSELRRAALEISESSPSSRRRSRSRKNASAAQPSVREEWSQECERIFERLRQWRQKEARSQGVPAFRVLSDRVLKAMVLARPGSRDDLLQVRGIGARLCEKYGGELLGYFKP